ncbi:CRISPR-associated helicase Cas3' [Phaeodactylibacter xiamenensis]|uniref:CRISPR-associated helicase Cas3' n=1 Tax=Phaeodactylibacter xiamenensis TaxID=1524460 RepID=UPI003BAC8632
MSKKKQTPLAKPSGITLPDHTRHVKEEAAYIVERLPFLAKKYAMLCGDTLTEDLLKAAKFHDWGKAYSIWQEACQKDHQAYLDWRASNKLPIDKYSSADYRRYEQEMRASRKLAGKHIFNASLRHEIASLFFIEKNRVELSEKLRTAIAAHHGKLSFKYKHRWKDDGRKSHSSIGPFIKYWNEIEALSDEVSDKDVQQILQKRYEFSAIRALLQLADTRASRKEGEGNDAHYELSSFPKVKRFPSLRPVQEAALQVSDQPISILRAPTGSGKTHAALLWAEEQTTKGRADRLVIAMPTRFTSNALAIGAAEQLGETGLYHSSAWYNQFGDLKYGQAYKEAFEAHRMAKYLATPVTVCTIDHLLISLTGTREAHHCTFFFLANSAVVFDEADFYDPFVQANMVVLIQALRVLKVPVLIMSATVPDSARSLYQVDYPIAVAKADARKTQKMLHYIGDSNSQKELVLQKMIDLGEGIIYANTVARALQYYRWLKDHVKEKDFPIVVYHSRFTEEDKKKIEEGLIDKLGKKAWENSDQVPVKGIAIMTQIGEMSVNISSTIMLSDLCPWDRLAQRIGRLARFDFQKEGLCYVITPLKKGLVYPAPYGEYSRKDKGWIPLKPFQETEKQLKEQYSEPKEITPENFVDYVNELYPEAPELDSHAAANQRSYQQLIRANWLILPDTRADEDEGHVGANWSSRHIPPQQVVYIEPPQDLSDYSDLQNFDLRYGVSVPQYLIEKELRKKEGSRISKLPIWLEKYDEEMTVCYTSDYSSKLGLAFLYDDHFISDVTNQIDP